MVVHIDAVEPVDRGAVVRLIEAEAAGAAVEAVHKKELLVEKLKSKWEFCLFHYLLMDKNLFI